MKNKRERERKRLTDYELNLHNPIPLIHTTILITSNHPSCTAGLTALVARISGRDPREYVPLLEKLSQMPDRECCFEIDMMLKRYGKAVMHAVKGGDNMWYSVYVCMHVCMCFRCMCFRCVSVSVSVSVSMPVSVFIYIER